MTTPCTPSWAETVSSAATMPMPGVGTRPSAMIWGTMRLTVSIGMAKPMPVLVPVGEKIAVLTPITRPAESSRGPPELPGLIEASVWITLGSPGRWRSAGAW
jgi:hypothetical protein